MASAGSLMTSSVCNLCTVSVNLQRQAWHKARVAPHQLAEATWPNGTVIEHLRLLDQESELREVRLLEVFARVSRMTRTKRFALAMSTLPSRHGGNSCA